MLMSAKRTWKSQDRGAFGSILTGTMSHVKVGMGHDASWALGITFGIPSIATFRGIRRSVPLKSPSNQVNPHRPTPDHGLVKIVRLRRLFKPFANCLLDSLP